VERASGRPCRLSWRHLGFEQNARMKSGHGSR